MKQNSRPFFSFVVLLIVFLGGYSYFVYAAAPPGGYNPGQTLNPDCAPGDTDCVVTIGTGGSVTANNGLTLTGSNIQLGGTLIHTTTINTAGNDFNVSNGNFNFGISNTLSLTGTPGIFSTYQDTTTNSGIGIADFGGASEKTPILIHSYDDGAGTTSSASFGVGLVAGGIYNSSIAWTTNFTSATESYDSEMVNLHRQTYFKNRNVNTGLSSQFGIDSDAGIIFSFSSGGPGDSYIFPRTDGSANQVLTTDGIGQLSWETPTSGGGPMITADNGLTLTSSNVQLGGPLTQDTLVETAGHDLIVANDLSAGLDTTAMQVGNYGGGPGISVAQFVAGSTIANAQVNIQAISYGTDAIGLMSYTNNTTGDVSQISVANSSINASVNNTIGDKSLSFGIGGNDIGINYKQNSWTSNDQGIGILINQNGVQFRGSDPINGYNAIFATYDPGVGGVRENVFLGNNGNWQWVKYPYTRDDSANTPNNFIYTDIGGNVLSAPLSGILPTGTNGLGNNEKDIELGGTLTKNTLILQDTFNYTLAQAVPSAGTIITTQGLATVAGAPGTVTGYIAPNSDSARHITWATGLTKNVIHTLSGSGDPDLLNGGAEITTTYDITDTGSAMVGMYAFDTPGNKTSRLQLTPTYLNLLLDPAGELRINNDAGTTGYVISSNGPGVAPTWEDPAMLVSDQRLKSNITDLTTDALSKIMNIRTVSYTLNSDDSNRTQIGFLAQDLQQYFPELVGEKADGTLGVYYAQMAPVLVEAIRELNIKVTTLDDLSVENSVREGMVKWLADAANGITKIYADVFESKQVQTEQLCIKDVCMDRDQLYNLMNQGGSPGNSTPDPVIIPDVPTESDPITDPESDPETTPETGNSDPAATE